MHDIAIIGGGPGGLYAGHRLAQRGFDVVVFEEHPSAGLPVHCTGVLAAEAFDEFDIGRDVILNPLRTARFFGPSGASIEYATPTVEAVVIDRRTFDTNLGERATAAGAHLSVGTRIIDIQVDESCVRVTDLREQVVEARACIVACGASYALQRRLGLGVSPLYLQSAQIEVPARNPGDVELHFGHDVAPKGFAWVVPVVRGTESFARIGLMCDRDARRHFDRFLASVGPRLGTGTRECLDGGTSVRSKMLPLAPIERTYMSRVLVVGDAAGLVKATTGGGIYYSLLTGSLAADVLGDALERDDLQEGTLSAYETKWRSALGEELDAQLTLRNIANQLSDDEIEDLFELARTDGVMPIVRRTATFNRHRTLILSLLSHPPLRRVLMRRVLGWGRTA